jgi:[protein-PII] uridylyltransferase
MLPEQFNPSAIPDDQLTIPFCKELLSSLQTWLKDQFVAQDDVLELVEARSEFTDLLLSRLWQKFGLDKHPLLALIAVGGYGRGELHPYSDIDILVLSQKAISPAQGETISQFLTLLWDLRLDIGHAVRSLKECTQQGKDDITIATNLLESRLICGSSATFDGLQDLLKPPKFWPSDAFFRAKREEQLLRHQQFQDTAFLLEPDVKSNPGGLRDLQIITWIARRQYGAMSLQNMTSFGFLNRAEYLELQDCQNFLWRVRFALHLAIQKNDNRLLFDRQRIVAEMLGYPGQGNAPVEQMMKRFFQTVRRITELNEMLLQLFDEAILGNESTKTKLLNENFILRGTHIDVLEPSIFQDAPHTILDLFYQIAENPDITGIYSSCLRALRDARRSLVVALQELPECRERFMAILRHPRGISLPFTLMHEHGILAAYLPQWSQIVGQMQFDMFHAYTVDEHTHRLLKNIYRFQKTERAKLHPLFFETYNRLKKPELLFIAALFHDIGKGRGGDHSELGANDAIYFCELHGLDRYEGRLVAWLVKNHLLFSVTAQRRDIYDPDVITEFAQVIRDEEHLGYLYCLTVADICATNDSLWNDWKGTLLKELFFATQRALRQGLENPPDMRLRIRENQRQSMLILKIQGYDEGKINQLWPQFKADYFLRHSSEQIAWHTRHILDHADNEKPLVVFGNHKTRGGSEIFLYCRDMPNLFATVAAILDHKNLDIHDAQIMSSKENYVMDTFVVMEPNGESVVADRVPMIIQSLEQALSRPGYSLPPSRPLSRRHRQFNVPTKVTFLPVKGDHKHSLIELVALDSPGVLARIGAVFQACEFEVHAAKITTIGERVEDFFSLSRLDGLALTDDDKKTLKEKLVEKLNPVDEM